MDISQVTHHDPRKETNTPRTPYEANRREAMHLKAIRYGFYRIGEEKKPEECAGCQTTTNIANVVINGVIRCRKCLSKYFHASR